MRVSQANVAIFSGIAVRSIFEDAAASDGQIEVWRLAEGAVTVSRWAGDLYEQTEIAGWTVLIRQEVIQAIQSARAAAGSQETGGILVGSWDRLSRRAYIVGAYDPPPDSLHSPTGFVRGLVGVHQTLEHVENSTAVNLSYIGEWHTHPARCNSDPSSDDEVLLRWIGDVLSFSDVPPLMAIAGDDGFRVIIGRIDHSSLS